MNIEDIEKTLLNYSNLSYRVTSEYSLEVFGSININRLYNKYSINEDFFIEILIDTSSPNKIPIVKDSRGVISMDYPHIYNNGALCLSTDSEILYNCDFNLSLEMLIENYIIPYYYSYKYYMRFTEYPFGERSHNIIGIFEFYSELLSINEIKSIFNFLNYAVSKTYRGHHECPCGSGKKIRNCHKSILQKIQTTPPFTDAVKKDLNIIRNEVKRLK